jgi:hypothetical protein
MIIASGSGQKAYESLELILKTLGARLSEKTSLLVQGPKSKLDRDGMVTDFATLQELKNLGNSFLESLSLQKTTM